MAALHFCNFCRKVVADDGVIGGGHNDARCCKSLIKRNVDAGRKVVIVPDDNAVDGGRLIINGIEIK